MQENVAINQVENIFSLFLIKNVYNYTNMSKQWRLVNFLREFLIPTINMKQI